MEAIRLRQEIPAAIKNELNDMVTWSDATESGRFSPMLKLISKLAAVSNAETGQETLDQEIVENVLADNQAFVLDICDTLADDLYSSYAEKYEEKIGELMNTVPVDVVHAENLMLKLYSIRDMLYTAGPNMVPEDIQSVTKGLNRKILTQKLGGGNVLVAAPAPVGAANAAPAGAGVLLGNNAIVAAVGAPAGPAGGVQPPAGAGGNAGGGGGFGVLPPAGAGGGDAGGGDTPEEGDDVEMGGDEDVGDEDQDDEEGEEEGVDPFFK